VHDDVVVVVGGGVGVGVEVPDDDDAIWTIELLEIVEVTTKHFFVGITLEVEDSEVLFCSEEENGSWKLGWLVTVERSTAILPII